VGFFRKRGARSTGNPLPEFAALLSEFGPNYALEHGQFVSVSTFNQDGLDGVRLRLTPTKDLLLAYSTEGVVAGFPDFAASIGPNTRVLTVAQLLNSEAALTDHPSALLVLLAGLRHKHSDDGDQGFGNETLQRFVLQSMAKSSMALGQAIDRGETGLDLETAANVRSALFPTKPVVEALLGKQIMIHRAYSVFSLAQIGWINELRNDSSEWVLRHWVTPSVAIELRESLEGYEWIASHNHNESFAEALPAIQGAHCVFEGSNLENAISVFVQSLLPLLRELPWQTIAGNTFEEMATIALDIEERRLTALIGLLQGNASDEEIQRFGDSSYEEWQGQ
jgi:hypothetical protein